MGRVCKTLTDKINVWLGRMRTEQLMSAVQIRADHGRICDQDRGRLWVFNFRKLLVVWDRDAHDCP